MLILIYEKNIFFRNLEKKWILTLLFYTGNKFLSFKRDKINKAWCKIGNVFLNLVSGRSKKPF